MQKHCLVVSWIRVTCDNIQLDTLYYCVLFSSTELVSGLGLDYSVFLVRCYAHVYIYFFSLLLHRVLNLHNA